LSFLANDLARRAMQVVRSELSASTIIWAGQNFPQIPRDPRTLVLELRGGKLLAVDALATGRERPREVAAL